MCKYFKGRNFYRKTFENFFSHFCLQEFILKNFQKTTFTIFVPEICGCFILIFAVTVFFFLLFYLENLGQFFLYILNVLLFMKIMVCVCFACLLYLNRWPSFELNSTWTFLLNFNMHLFCYIWRVTDFYAVYLWFFVCQSEVIVSVLCWCTRCKRKIRRWIREWQSPILSSYGVHQHGGDCWGRIRCTFFYVLWRPI